MNDNKIYLSGIFSEGYGIVPKKLMKMEIPNNVKLILAYMLSYTGGGNSCFPSYDTIAKHLKMSKSTISRAINYCKDEGLIHVEKLNTNNPLNHSNKYILDFLSMPLQERTDDSTEYGTTDSTIAVPTTVPQEYCNNNIYNNNINNRYPDVSQIDHIPEEPKICEYLKYYYQVYNRYYGITDRPKPKDYQTIKDIKIAVNNDLERYKLIVNTFFEKEYFFNRDGNKKPLHYLKSLSSNIGTVAKDAKQQNKSVDHDAKYKAWLAGRKNNENK